MLDLCHETVSLGEKLGADETEAMWMEKVFTTIKAGMGEMSEAFMTRYGGLRIRVVKNKALGSAFTYQIDESSVRKSVENALHEAQAAQAFKNEQGHSLPSPGKYSNVAVWDPKMEEIGPDDLIDPVIEIFQLLPQDIAVYLAVNEIVLNKRACVNTNGIVHAEKGTLENFILWAGKAKDVVSPAFCEASFLREYNPDPCRFVEEITASIALFEGPESATSGRFPVIFSPQALQELFQYALFGALSGGNVASKNSLLAGKEKEKIASSLLTLHDNGIVREGAASGEMDDEGVPHQDTLLIEEGVLQGFIWNDYWAKRVGVSSTGNAHYNERTGEMFIKESTMVVTPGEYRREELLEVKDGYYILDLQRPHESTTVLEDFSLASTPAFRIRDGEIVGGITGMVVSDNIFSLLNKIDAVGNEPKVCESAILPHVRFTDVNIVCK